MVWVVRPDAWKHAGGGGAGIRTRLFDDVIDEVEGYFEAHRQLGTFPGGIHVELTRRRRHRMRRRHGRSRRKPTCISGNETACDPRLNREQSLELAFLVADMLLKR